MKIGFKALLVGFSLVLFSSLAIANDIEGKIESVSKDKQSFVVQGIEFFVNDSTDYDDGLNEFSDLEKGQTVEVDFEYRDEKHVAEEIELKS